jgi:hypothetical protein
VRDHARRLAATAFEQQISTAGVAG